MHLCSWGKLDARVLRPEFHAVSRHLSSALFGAISVRKVFSPMGLSLQTWNEWKRSREFLFRNLPAVLAKLFEFLGFLDGHHHALRLPTSTHVYSFMLHLLWVYSVVAHRCQSCVLRYDF